MKQTSDDFLSDLIGETIQIILVRRGNHGYGPDVETVWSEGRVRAAYLSQGMPAFLLQRDDVIKLSFFDQAHGHMFIRVAPAHRTVAGVAGVAADPATDPAWHTRHLDTCGTAYRGCDPQCPKELAERKAAP